MRELFSKREFNGTKKPHNKVISTICRGCKCGCGITAYVHDNVIVDIHGDPCHFVNEGRLCARAVGFPKVLNRPDRLYAIGMRERLKDPLRRVEDPVEALGVLANRLRLFKNKYGPESLWIECNEEVGLDFLWGAVKFAKLWGTPHVYHYPPINSLSQKDLCDFPGLRSTDYSWEKASCFLFVESDLAETQPVFFGRVLKYRDSGTKIAAVDTHFTTTLSKTSKSLIIRPGTGNLFGLTILKIMLEEGLCDQGLIPSTFINGDKWQQNLSDLSLDKAVSIIGISPSDVVEFARYLSRLKCVIVFTGKPAVSDKSHVIWAVLSLVTGWDQLGGGWHPVEMEPINYCTKQEISTPETTEKIVICGGDCLDEPSSIFHSDTEQLRTVIYFGAFPGQTLPLSHMVFPASLWPEREEICFSENGIVQWGNMITESPGISMSGFDFWYGLAERLGLADKFVLRTEEKPLLAFYKEILGQFPATRNIDISGLVRSKSPQFLDFPGKMASTKNLMIPFDPKELEQQIEQLNKHKYPLIFQSTPVSNLSGICKWSPWLRELESTDIVRISPSIASKLGIKNDEIVVVIGGSNSFKGRARISKMVPDYLVCSPRKLGARSVLIYKQGQIPEEALKSVREVL